MEAKFGWTIKIRFTLRASNWNCTEVDRKVLPMGRRPNDTLHRNATAASQPGLVNMFLNKLIREQSAYCDLIRYILLVSPRLVD